MFKGSGCQKKRELPKKKGLVFKIKSPNEKKRYMKESHRIDLRAKRKGRGSWGWKCPEKLRKKVWIIKKG